MEGKISFLLAIFNCIGTTMNIILTWIPGCRVMLCPSFLENCIMFFLGSQISRDLCSLSQFEKSFELCLPPRLTYQQHMHCFCLFVFLLWRINFFFSEARSPLLFFFFNQLFHSHFSFASSTFLRAISHFQEHTVIILFLPFKIKITIIKKIK